MKMVGKSRVSNKNNSWYRHNRMYTFVQVEEKTYTPLQNKFFRMLQRRPRSLERTLVHESQGTEPESSSIVYKHFTQASSILYLYDVSFKFQFSFLTEHFNMSYQKESEPRILMICRRILNKRSVCQYKAEIICMYVCM